MKRLIELRKQEKEIQTQIDSLLDNDWSDDYLEEFNHLIKERDKLWKEKLELQTKYIKVYKGVYCTFVVVMSAMLTVSAGPIFGLTFLGGTLLFPAYLAIGIKYFN